MKQDYAIYVHIPFCKARCGYCAFSSCTNYNLREKYFEKLCSEISLAEVPTDVRIKTMFWGGGTPSSVGVEYLKKLYESISSKFDLTEMEEFTVECNPESTTEELLEFLRSIGVNRLSFGLQSVNDETLKRIGRLHTYNDFLSALALAQKPGFENISADLILGLPESRTDFLNSVQTVVKLPLQHISLYALEVHEQNSSFAKLCEKFAFSDDELADMYDAAMSVLSENGFERYEVSNFAKVGRECRHNLMYWTENRYFGFGAAACGFVENIRYGNFFEIEKYLQKKDLREYSETIDKKTEMNEYVMLALRLRNGFLLDDFRRRFNADFFKEFPNAERLMRLGVLQNIGGAISLPNDKFYVLNSVLVELLPD